MEKEQQEQRIDITDLEDKIVELQKSDVKNFEQHKEILNALQKNNDILKPIADTYRTVGIMSKWIMAFLIFMSVLGGTIITWSKLIKK